MKILIACEESQRVCISFREKGHEAYSCDIQECSGGHPKWHIKGDVLEILNGYHSFYTQDGEYNDTVLNDNWDMIIAHPPCTYLSNAGARHLYKGHRLNKERYLKGCVAKDFFMKFINAECDKICIENPTPSKIYELPKWQQTVQPYYFGDPYTKRTHLWLRGLPQLQPTNIVEPIGNLCPSGSYSHKHGEKHRGIYTKDRAKNRSKTFWGVAMAMAEQWG